MNRPIECPRCQSTDTSRSHRKRIEYLLLGVRFFRCNQCQTRFHHFLLSNIWQASAS
jgi:transposase-like protein